MSHKIEPKDVLSYLNELGYTNINAQQLKDFITDLKKLIKYENKHRQREYTDTPMSLNNVNRCPCAYIKTHLNQQQNSIIVTDIQDKPCCNHPLCPRNQINSQVREVGDIFNRLHTEHTVASSAKETARRNKCISVHIKKPKIKPNLDKQWVDSENKSKEDIEKERDIEIVHNIEAARDGSKLYVNTESTIRSAGPSSKQSLSKKSSPSKRKSKCSFIRTSSVKSVNKTDPVALYHYYQDQWKKQKFPGQENHSDLRWAVREKMLSGPKVEIPPTVTFARRSNCWRG